MIVDREIGREWKEVKRVDMFLKLGNRERERESWDSSSNGTVNERHGVGDRSKYTTYV